MAAIRSVQRTSLRSVSGGVTPVGDSFDESLHALPGWFAWFQKTFGLSFIVLSEAYLMGSLATTGWVSALTFPVVFGSFRGIGVIFFFLAGVAVAGIGLTLSVVFVGSIKRRSWFMALFAGSGCLVFFCVEVWASLSERSLYLLATPADVAVLSAFGFKGHPTISPTVLVVSILFPLGSLFFGFAQQRRAAVTQTDLDEDAMEMERKIRRAEQEARLVAAEAKKNAARARGAVSILKAGVQAARSPADSDENEQEAHENGQADTSNQEAQEPDDDADEVLGAASDKPSTLEERRRRWEQMDALRARMLREGYPLTGLSDKANEAVWYSLAKRTRRAQLAALLGMTPDQVEPAVVEVRKKRRATGRS
jgi:hypothetical protein